MPGTVYWSAIVGNMSDQAALTAALVQRGLLTNYSVSAQVFPTTARTYLVGSAVAVPVGKLRIGTLIRWTFDLTKTAAGVAVSTFDICVGTAGTTADVARMAFVKPVGTAVIDNGRVVIECLVRGPLSASGIAVGHFHLTHNRSATGLATIPVVDVTTVSAPFDVTVANLFVGVCVTPGAAEVLTVQQVLTEAWNL